MVTCAVVGCKNNNNKRCRHSETKVRYFTFPAHQAVRDVWIQRCRQKCNFKAVNGRICSEHFNEEDYCVKEKLLNLPAIKWKLKKDAIPSVNLPQAELQQVSSHDERSNGEKRRSLEKDIRQ